MTPERAYMQGGGYVAQGVTRNTRGYSNTSAGALHPGPRNGRQGKHAMAGALQCLHRGSTSHWCKSSKPLPYSLRCCLSPPWGSTEAGDPFLRVGVAGSLLAPTTRRQRRRQCAPGRRLLPGNQSVTFSRENGAGRGGHPPYRNPAGQFAHHSVDNSVEWFKI